MGEKQGAYIYEVRRLLEEMHLIIAVHLFELLRSKDLLAVAPLNGLRFIAGLGNYQQQDLQYGPARGSSFPSDNSYSSYGTTDPAGYPGAAPGYGGETASFGRGSSASRGFHPYGR